MAGLRLRHPAGRIDNRLPYSHIRSVTMSLTRLSRTLLPGLLLTVLAAPGARAQQAPAAGSRGA